MASILEAAIGDALGLYGEKPNVPGFNPVSTTDSQANAILGNLQNFGSAKQLVAETNAANQDQLNLMLRKAIPGYDSLLTKTRSIVDSQLKGEIPNDVMAAINRNGASRALAGGFGGSQMAGNLTARDLGLTSLQLTNQGLDSASRWMQQARQNVAPMFDISSAFLSPAQKLGVDVQQNSDMWNRDWLSAQVSAAASPTEQAYMQGISSDLGVFSSMAGSAMGGMAGGGGGGGSM